MMIQGQIDDSLFERGQVGRRQNTIFPKKKRTKEYTKDPSLTEIVEVEILEVSQHPFG